MSNADRENEQAKAVQRALELVTEALDVLDTSGGSTIAAAHLAVALQKLQEDLAARR